MANCRFRAVGKRQLNPGKTHSDLGVGTLRREGKQIAKPIWLAIPWQIRR